MIPRFPTFKKIELSDKIEIEKITLSHPPTSDFNFVSLWNYDTQNTSEISILENNLIIKFEDYLTQENFLSFIGTHSILHTIKRLFAHSVAMNLSPTLKLIPESAIQEELPYLKELYSISEDPDNFDYILSLEKTISLSGNQLISKRKDVNKFLKLYPQNEIRTLNIKNEFVQSQILDLFSKWKSRKQKSDKQTEKEFQAIQKCFMLAQHYELITIGLHFNKELIGFSINELIHSNQFMVHFAKADYYFTGSFSYLIHKTAKHMQQFDREYINLQQDLGIPGLKLSKDLWRPIQLVKKYTINQKPKVI